MDGNCTALWILILHGNGVLYMQELVSVDHRTPVEKMQLDNDDLKKVKVKLIERAMAYDFQGLCVVFFLQYDNNVEECGKNRHHGKDEVRTPKRGTLYTIWQRNNLNNCDTQCLCADGHSIQVTHEWDTRGTRMHLLSCPLTVL